MNESQWERIKEIFEKALDLPLHARSDFLLQRCKDNPLLQMEVEELLAADAKAGSFLEVAWLAAAIVQPPEFTLHPGDVVSGRFHIVRPLGYGGMGRVYEAHDSELGVQIALKTLRPEIATNPEVLFRFRQEVRIAHRITHPNVCRTFHLDREVRRVGPDDRNLIDITFITMEYLNGETLQEILKSSGRLSPNRAFAIAHQMADAIEAAHQIEVIHRDIKPGNIMICPTVFGGLSEERVVITDFGLAKLKAGTAGKNLSSISHPGHTMGTLAYMAPEQLTAGDVGPAADIYAFGLVLFEMVTGAKAFPDSASVAAALHRLTDTPPSPKSLVPDLPLEWETAILRCLQIDPAARPQHAADVISVLEGATAAPSFPLRARTFPKPKWRALLLNRKILALASVIAVFLSALWSVSRLFSSRADSIVAPGTLVYMPPVRNETGEKQLDNVNELMRVGLEQSAHINLLDAGRVGDILQQMTKPPDTEIDAPTAREIAMRAGAARVIFASVLGSGGIYHLNVDIQQPDNTPKRYRNHWPTSFSWHSTTKSGNSTSVPPELLLSIRMASNWVREKAGESANDIARLDASPEDVTTANWEALEEFVNSETFVTRREPEKAILALQNAIALDPKFAFAHARLGDLLFSLNRASQGYEEYSRALGADLEHRLTRKERDFIKGAYAVDTWDFSAAEIAFRDYAAYYENDYAGVFFRAYPLRMLGRLTEAVDVLKRAQEISPKDSGTYVGLAYDYMLLGRFEDARQCVDDLTRLGFPDEASLISGHLAFLVGNYTDARQAFENLKASRTIPHRSLSYSLIARVEAELGRSDDALKTLTAGIEYDRSVGRSEFEASKLLDRAYIECATRRIKSCVDDSARAFDLDSRPEAILQNSATVGEAIPHTAPSSAMELKAHLKNLRNRLGGRNYGPIYDLARLRLNGELKLAEGEISSALADFRRASVIDSPTTDRAYLARALTAAADKEPRTTERRRLQVEALAAYSRSVNNPSIVWYYSPHYPPGFLADQIEDYLQLASLLGDHGERQQELKLKHGSLRGNRHASLREPQ